MCARLRRDWHDLLQAWGVEPLLADRTFDEVCAHYASPGRFYHTIDHVANVLQTVSCLGRHVRNPRAVRLAVWLHDVIYDSTASDNEERSAAYALRLCESLAIAEADRVAKLILKTKGHEAGDDADAQVLLDADLSILGANPVVYRSYAQQIRQEYAWVPEADYRRGRRQVLRRFLARPRIYHFLTELEAPARGNISDEIALHGAE
jgi:predicted metal-dependent HD superfamily phosphohydrolase